MDNKKTVHQGEVLMLLVKRSPYDGIEVAKMMGINQSYLSKIYNQPTLTIKVRRAAAAAPGVDLDIFETGLGYEIPESREDRVGDDGEEYRSLAMENERLKEENARLAADLLRERDLSEDLRKTLLLIAGKNIG